MNRGHGSDFGKVTDPHALELIEYFEAVLASLVELKILKGRKWR